MSRAVRGFSAISAVFDSAGWLFEWKSKLLMGFLQIETIGLIMAHLFYTYMREHRREKACLFHCLLVDAGVNPTKESVEETRKGRLRTAIDPP